MNIVEGLHYMMQNVYAETLDVEGARCRFNGEEFQEKSEGKWRLRVYLVNLKCNEEYFTFNNFFDDFQEALDLGVAMFKGENATFENSHWVYDEGGSRVFDDNHLADLLDLKNWTKRT